MPLYRIVEAYRHLTVKPHKVCTCMNSPDLSGRQLRYVPRLQQTKMDAGNASGSWRHHQGVASICADHALANEPGRFTISGSTIYKPLIQRRQAGRHLAMKQTTHCQCVLNVLIGTPIT